MSMHCKNKREVNYRILLNYLVYMRRPLQTNQTLQEIGACWHTKNAFLDFSSANFLQSRQIWTIEITTHLPMRISIIQHHRSPWKLTSFTIFVRQAVMVAFFFGGGGGREIKSITVLANQWIDKLSNSLFSICSGR